MDFRADLHCHSFFSDGTLSPKELLYLAKEMGLNGLSITDHDTTLAYQDALFDLAKELNIALLPGVEISSTFQNYNVHILGYGFDLSSKILNDFLIHVVQMRKERNLKILQKLQEHNIKISQEELYQFALKKGGCSDTTIGRPHIAQIMVEKGYVKDFYEAFDLYIKDTGPCYVSGFKCTPMDVIDKIHAANGKAVLAHPHVFRNSRLVHQLLELPFDGMECFYGKLLPHDERKWIALAEDKNMIITGGSDFHGEIRPYLELGSSWVNQETFLQLSK